MRSGRIRMLGLIGALGSVGWVAVPITWAADETTAEAAEATSPDVTLDHLREAISDETDPALRQVMEEQLALVESGELELDALKEAERQDIALGAPTEAVGGGRPAGELAGPLPMPVVDVVGGTSGRGGNDEYLPPAAREELQKLFEQGTGDPTQDGHLREQAEQILEKYGIESRDIGMNRDFQGETSPREAFGQWERSEEGQRTDTDTVERYREMSEQYQAEFERGGMERGMEHMAPEAREQMERFSGEPREAVTREYEAQVREHEMSSRDYEAPTREFETSSRDYEAPTHEYEAPTYEAPTHEYESPTHEYESQDMTMPHY